MGDHSAIGWTEATWNPTVGCSKVSPGCDNCYAIRSSVRLVASGNVAYRGVLTPDMRDWSGRVNSIPDRLDQPLHWKKPRLIFVDSMSDLFHPGVSDSFIVKVFAVMSLARQHTFQVLTKRPQRMAELVDRPTFQRSVENARYGFHRYARTLDADAWPLPNVWLGTSIENDTYTWRTGYLHRTPAVVRWLSLEPLLSDLPSLDVDGLDWVVAGGESGPGHRDMHPDWLANIAVVCHLAGVPLFVKQDSHARSGMQGRIPDVLWARKDYPEAVRHA